MRDHNGLLAHATVAIAKRRWFHKLQRLGALARHHLTKRFCPPSLESRVESRKLGIGDGSRSGSSLEHGNASTKIVFDRHAARGL